MIFDVAIVGGGIVGLATAYHLVRTHHDWTVVVIEKEPDVASHQTGRNSGVIHSGIYYKPGSLKAENCRLGREALIRFCEEEGVTYEVCGKVIVAVEPNELPQLNRILERGRENGVACDPIGADRLRELEPHCAGIEAISVPGAGIVDFVGMSKRLAAIIVENGGTIRTSSKVIGMEELNDRVVVSTEDGDLEAGVVVNCAGLYADRIARMSGVDPEMQIVPFRGEYYELVEGARHLCRNLIYPVPDPAYPFLGVHFTRMYDGSVECGPSAVMAFAREGYRFGDVDFRELVQVLGYRGFRRLAARHWKTGAREMLQSLSKRFYLKGLKRLIPEIKASDLKPAASGVRAQAVRDDGSMVDDFLILEKERFINVCSAPSPAATACLNIGRLVGDKIAAHV
jgi:L-2-hydroxyglutarate oxidase